tara:strand:- start:218 stop:358 length:141 start_codon:yes stop_codon:yes gene_type:complete
VEACKVNWTEILERGHVAEPPGRTEVMADIQSRPYRAPEKKKKGKK